MGASDPAFAKGCVVVGLGRRDTAPVQPPVADRGAPVLFRPSRGWSIVRFKRAANLSLVSCARFHTHRPHFTLTPRLAPKPGKTYRLATQPLQQARVTSRYSKSTVCTRSNRVGTSSILTPSDRKWMVLAQTKQNDVVTALARVTQGFEYPARDYCRSWQY